MLWIMIAAQLSAPAPVNSHVSDIRALFSYWDVPDYLIGSGEVRRTVYTRTTVRDDGTVESCATELPSGDAKLDAYTCALILKRAKFGPAKWIDGTPAYVVLRFPVNWTVTESILSETDMLKAIVPDLELYVNQLPKGAHKIVDLTLEVAANEAGHIVSCLELSPDKNDHRRHFPSLVPIACEQAEKSLSLRPPTDRSGKPIRSVQTALVRLALDH